MEIQVKATKKMSKSQKRKQRLLNKGKQLSLVAQPAANPGKRRGNRIRNRKRSPMIRGNDTSYIHSLMYPEQGEGAKIPDLVAFPSGTLQLRKAGVLSTAATTGDTVGLLFTPVIGNGSSVYPIQLYGSATAGSFGSATNTSWPARAASAAAFGLFRPVSASVKIYFIGNTTSDGGRICGGCLGLARDSTLPTTYALLEDAPETDEWAQRNGMEVLWKPFDDSNFIYATNVGCMPGIAGQIINYPSIMIGVTGLPAGTTSVAFEVVCNFEAIPSLEYYDLVDSTPSPFNQNILRRAFEWASESGNNIRALANSAGPFIQAAQQVYGLAGQLGYVPLPQREFGNRRMRARGMTLASLVSNNSSLVDAKSSGKDEENEDDVHDSDVQRAMKKFTELSMTEIEAENRPSSSPSLRIGTPKGSPISIRKTGGQV